MGTSGQWAVSSPKYSTNSIGIGRAIPSTQTKRTFMKRTIKQRFVSWLLQTQEDDYGPISVVEQSDINLDGAVRFDLVSATGGRILQVRRWDRNHDNQDTTTYVIPSGEDVGERVAKILNLELLK